MRYYLLILLKVYALYAYAPQETYEIGFEEGDICNIYFLIYGFDSYIDVLEVHKTDDNVRLKILNINNKINM